MASLGVSWGLCAMCVCFYFCSEYAAIVRLAGWLVSMAGWTGVSRG